jgi:hypothetical protein
MSTAKGLRDLDEEDYGGRMSDQEIEAEVARSSEQNLSFTYAMFVDFSDGRRVVEQDTRRFVDIGRHPVVFLAPGEQPPSEGDLLPNRAAVEETLKHSIELGSPKDRWEEVVELLKREGLKTSPRQLDALPLDFELDARAIELASGNRGPESYPNGNDLP